MRAWSRPHSMDALSSDVPEVQQMHDAYSERPTSTIPLVGTKPMPTPTEAQAKAPTQTEMRNVDFHVDETTIMKIHQLRGEMIPKQPGTPLNFDNKTSFVLKVDRAKIGLTGANLDSLMNRYVLNASNSPLRNLHATPDGKQLKHA